MVLIVGESYTAANGITTVIEGTITQEQQAWLGKNRDQPIDERPYLTLTPAQILYLALCKNGFNLQEALESCDLNEDEAAEAKTALKIFDADGVVKKITRPSFVGADLQGYDLEGADLRYADLRGADLRRAEMQRADLRDAALGEADLRDANLQDAELWGVDLRGAILRGADLRRAKMQRAYLPNADLRGTDLQNADLRGAEMQYAKLNLTDLTAADFAQAQLDHVEWNLAFYDAANPPNNLSDYIFKKIKDNLVALDQESYERATELQADYQKAITAAEGALTEHLEQCRQDNAKKALQSDVSLDGSDVDLGGLADGRSR